MDADHAGDETTCKSTGGELLWLYAPTFDVTRLPTPPAPAKIQWMVMALISWACRRHGQVSSSTAESELYSAHSMITKCLLPTASVLEQMLKRDVGVAVDIDNDAARIAIEKGLSPALRYTRKHRRVSIARTHDLVKSCGIIVGRVASQDNHSDVLTKGLKEDEYIRHVRGCGLVFPGASANRPL